MAEGGLEDLVELGFEGVDKATDRYYDKVHDAVYPRVHRMRQRHDQDKPKHGHSASDQQRDDGPSYSSAPRRSKERPRQMTEEELRDPYHRQRDKRNRAPSPADEYEPSRRWEPPSAGQGYGSGYQENVPYGYGQESYQQNNAAWNASGQYEPAQTPYQPYNPAAYAAAGAYATGRSGYSHPDRSGHFSPSSDEYNDGRDSPPKSRHSRSSSDSRSPSPQRRSSRRDHDRDRSKHHPSDKALGARVAGAIAGGLIGHKAGKGDVFTSIVGAAVGAFGADAVGKRYEKDREKGQRKQMEWEQKWDKGRSGNEDSGCEGDEKRQRKYR